VFSEITPTPDATWDVYTAWASAEDEGFVRPEGIDVCMLGIYELEHCDGSLGWLIDSDYYGLSQYLGHYVHVWGPIVDPGILGGACKYIDVWSLEVIEPDPCRTTCDIWISGGHYYFIGDTVTICYDVSRPAYIRIWSITTAGNWIVLEGWDDGTGDCIYRTAAEPRGQHTLYLRVFDDYGNEVCSDDTWIWVEESPTKTPTPTPTPTRTPAPTATVVVCGQVFWATSCSGGFLYPIFFPCGSSTPYLWQPPDFTPGAYYRVYDPAFDTMDPLCTREYGNVTNRLISWSRYEQIASCAECGVPPPATPTPALGAADLEVVAVSPEPAVPAARQPFSVVVTLQNRNRNTRYDPGNGHYKAKVTIRPPFEDGWTLSFNSRDGDSARHLQPPTLPVIKPLGTVQIRISDLSFPLGFNSGAVDVEVTPENNDTTPDNNRATGPLSISGIPIGFEQCVLGLVKHYVGRLLGLGELGKVPTEIITKIADQAIDLARDLDIECQSRDGYDRGCIVDKLASITKLANLTVGELFDLISAAVQLLAPPIKEVAGCLLWILQSILDLVAKLNTLGVTVNAVASESPVYILATNSLGQRIGFFDNGSSVQELEDGRIINQDGMKILLYPGTDTANVRVKGASTGIFDLRLVLSKGGSTAVKVEYLGVPTNSRMVGTVDARDERYVMAIDENGDGIIDSTRLPDNITVFKPYIIYLPLIVKSYS